MIRMRHYLRLAFFQNLRNSFVVLRTFQESFFGIVEQTVYSENDITVGHMSAAVRYNVVWVKGVMQHHQDR